MLLLAAIISTLFSGFGVLIIIMPVNAIAVYFYKGIYQTMSKRRDQRTKKMNEILQGMKILKLYAWEPSFIDEIENIRSQVQLAVNGGLVID